MTRRDTAGEAWWRLSVIVDEDVHELVADRLLGSGAVAVQEEAVTTGIRLSTGFPDEAAAKLAASGISDLTGNVEIGVIVDDGLDSWRHHAEPTRTDRFVIVPTWRSIDADTDRVRIDIDPRRTFGSGSHPSTRLCLDLLAHVDPIGLEMLDVGTGSGILAIGALLLGAISVQAIDTDPASPGVAVENARRNGVSDRLDVSTSSIDEVAGTGTRFDVVTANLLAPIVRDMAPALATATAPDGHLIIGGLLEGQRVEIRGRLAEVGLEVVRETGLDGWSALLLRARPPTPIPS